MILATVVAYLLVLAAIGGWAARRTNTTADYFVAGRRLGGGLAALSYAAGSSSAWSILGVSGIAYVQGASAIWLLPGTLLGHLVVWFVLAPALYERGRSGEAITLTDVLTAGFEPADRLRIARVAAMVIVASFLFYIAAQFQGAGTTLATIAPVSAPVAMLVGAALVLGYTLLGGFWAASVTDALQALIMLLVALLTPVFVLPLFAAPGSGALEGFLRALQSSAPAWGSVFGAGGGWFVVGLLVGALAIGFGPLGQPHLLNRIIALENVAALRRARRVTLAWFTLVLSSMFFLGLAGHLLQVPVDDPEQVLFALAGEALPTALAGLLVAAVLSAIMSTADSQLLVAASALTSDLNPTTATLGRARLATLALAGAALLVALFLPEAIFSRVLFAWNALGAAFGPVLIARLLGWRCSATRISQAIGLGFGLTLVFYLLPNAPGDVAERALPFIAVMLLLRASRRSA